MACHTINNNADSYAHERDAMEWKNKIKSVVEEYESAILHLSIIMPKTKIYDFKWTKRRKVYNRSSKSKRIPFLEHLKKCCFLKVVKRRITKELLHSEFLDEIRFTIVVYK